ncbi:MAG: ZIP family metal transporter [Solirubrobacterales bacterium]|nr:ZIP family metal transporter [Solirubrobacterales bacterium]
MEAGTGRDVAPPRAPAWLLGAAPLALLALAVALLVTVGAPGLGDRNGAPVEELAVERTQMEPGEIALTVRNEGPDPVSVEQVSVNDAYYPFSGGGEIGRLGSATLTIPYPWIEGEAYEVFLLTSSGATVEAAIDAAAESPAVDPGFLGLMALLGIYVGVIPVAIGMLWLPLLRRSGPHLVRGLLAFTVGLLAFLGVDALLEGLEVAGAGPQALGGTALVLLGAVVSYLLLAWADAGMRSRRRRAGARGAPGFQLAMLVAIGIGLHNLGEGILIGSAYTAGALALGSFLVVGFAIHNTTEGLAIVAPLAESRVSVRRLSALGLVAGAPAVLGAWIGASIFNPSLVSVLFGLGIGAIAQVIVQIWPGVRSSSGQPDGTVYGGLILGALVMYATGLLISA